MDKQPAHAHSSVGWITHPLPNFNGCTVQVSEWMNYFIPRSKMGVITYPCFDKKGLVSKRRCFVYTKRAQSFENQKNSWYHEIVPVVALAVVPKVSYLRDLRHIQCTTLAQGYINRVRLIRNGRYFSDAWKFLYLVFNQWKFVPKYQVNIDPKLFLENEPLPKRWQDISWINGVLVYWRIYSSPLVTHIFVTRVQWVNEGFWLQCSENGLLFIWYEVFYLD